MDLSALRAPRPVPPRLSTGDKRVQVFLRDLEKVKTSRRPHKQLKRSEELIHRIVHTLRRSDSDHILFTTCIWTLISLFRLFPEPIKEVMLGAGVPGVLHDVLLTGMLSGSMRQYTSELCFFLASNQPYPDKRIPTTGPMTDLPEISAGNRYSGQLDDVSLSSDVSSEVFAGNRDSKRPFVPYRINAQNMLRLDALFQQGQGQGYEEQGLPPNAMRLGFAANNDHQQWTVSDSDSEGDGDEASLNSTLSSGTRSSLAYSMDSISLASSVVHSQTSASQFASQSQGQGHSLGQMLSLQKQAAKALGLAHRGDSGPGGGLGGNRFREHHLRHQPQSGTQAATFRIGGFGAQAQAQAQPSNSQSGFQLASGSLAVPSLLGASSSHYPDTLSSGGIGEGGFDSPKARLRQAGMSTDLGEDSWYTQAHEQTLPKGLGQGYGGGQEQRGYQRHESKDRDKDHLHLHPHFRIDRPRTTTVRAPMETNDLNVGMRTHDRATPILHRSIADSQYGDRYEKQMPSRERSPTRVRTALPSLTRAVHARPGSGAQFGTLPSTAPHMSHSLGSRDRGKELRRGRQLDSEVGELLAQLDPLALSLNIARSGGHVRRRLNTAGHAYSGGGDENSLASQASQASWLSDEYEEGYDDEDDTTVTDEGFFDSAMVEGSRGGVNPFETRKRQRIRAEKLVDHTFTRKLFSKKATALQAQNLISRMSSLLELMDPQDTGFVTWEAFARLILAVAPSHLLRADVMAFMAAQTESDQNLIDYKEFIISGKVMVIDKNSSKDFMPTMGWLNRQKLYSGDESTHTWRNHVKWYQSRKSKAVVWLMRRATRSLKHAELLKEAETFLLYARRRGQALTYLMTVGYVAVNSQDVWIDAKRRLLQRAMHARRWAQTTDAAQSWLASTARGENERLTRLEQQVKEVRDKGLAVAVVEETRARQADYSTFYKLHQYTAMASGWLRARAVDAKKHSDVRDAVQAVTANHAHGVLMHMLFVEAARSWLKMAGETAHAYCMKRDDVMKFLYRRGRSALKFLIRQEDALTWLMQRSAKAQRHSELQDDTLEALCEQGQRTLRYLNRQEEAYANLVARRQRAVILKARKAEAFAHLSTRTAIMWAHVDRQRTTQSDLAQSAQGALLHLLNKAKAFQSLQYTGAKAAGALRRQNIAFTDLQQAGQQAKIAKFKIQMGFTPQYANRVKEETKRQQAMDKNLLPQRQALGRQERWRAELLEAFDWVAISVTPVCHQGGPKKLIGRVGFARLMKGGQLLGLTRPQCYDAFKAVDPASACFVPFDAVWIWFLHHAQMHEATLPKLLFFTAKEIMSAQDRACITVLKRLNAEKVELTTSLEWEALEEARRLAKEEAESSEEEEENVDDIDDDTLFNDPAYAHLVGSDIGRLMRYITKRKQIKEKAAREIRLREELRAAAEAKFEAAGAAAKKKAMDSGSDFLMGTAPRRKIIPQNKQLEARGGKEGEKKGDGAGSDGAAGVIVDGTGGTGVGAEEGGLSTLADFLDDDEPTAGKPLDRAGSPTFGPPPQNLFGDED